jgi:hypothetical protein
MYVARTAQHRRRDDRAPGRRHERGTEITAAPSRANQINATLRRGRSIHPGKIVATARAGRLRAAYTLTGPSNECEWLYVSTISAERPT